MTVKIVVPTSSSLPLTKRSGSLARGSGGECGTDRARLTGETRRPYLGGRAQQRGEFLEALAHGTAENEHVWPQQPVQLGQVLVHPRDPAREIETLGRAHVRGGPLLCVHSTQPEVTELGIRKQLPAGE